MKYVITYQGDVSDKLLDSEHESHWVNTDGNTVQEINRPLGEMSSKERFFAIIKMTSTVTAEARKNGFILSIETIPCPPQGKEAV